MLRQTKDFLHMFAACNRMSTAIQTGGEPSEDDLKYIGVTAERFKTLRRTR